MTTTMLSPLGVSTAHPGARVIIPAADLADRDTWLAARQAGVTSTNARVLSGHGYTGEDVYGIWQEKITPITAETRVPLAWRIGADMETLIAQYAMEDLKVRMSKVGMLRSTVHPHLLDNPDRSCSCGGLVELKRTHTYYLNAYEGEQVNADRWALPPAWLAQCRHHLLVSGRSHVHLAALVADRDRLTHWTVERDTAAEQVLLELENMFWFDHVLTRTPPPISWDTVTVEEMRKRHPEAVIPSIVLDSADTQTMLGLIRRRVAGKAIGKTNVTELTLVENQMRAMIGDAVEVFAADGKTRLVKYGNGEAIKTDLLALVADHPDVELTRYQSATKFRSFNSVVNPAKVAI